MLNENGLTFKDFEKKTFEMICKLGQEYTRDFLERYDTYLMETRDKDAYRNKGKKKITEMTGQSISAMGVWNVIQALGEKVCEDEQKLVKAHKAGQLKGDKEAPVLFEETDGVYIRLQRENKIRAR